MRQNSENVKYACRQFIKECIWFLTNRHQQGSEKNICLFSTRRGGSTWLMEIIAANKGIRYSDQPFSLLSGSVTPGQLLNLPRFDYGQLIHLDQNEEEMIKNYLDRLFNGSLQVNAPSKLWRQGFHFKTDRVVLKIVAAKGIIDWIDTNFPVHIVYSTRHPIAQALSCLRNKWILTAKAYLRNAYFTGQYLDPVQLAYCHDILKEGSMLQKYVLNWALENLIPIRLLPERPGWIFVSYEECVLSPERVIQRLARELRLSDIDAMMKKVGAPSKSTKQFSTEETQQMIKSHQSDSMIKGWKKFVSDEEERAAFQILEKLQIPLYQYGQYVPSLIRDDSELLSKSA